jgi:lysophospholipase L1-like esterase
VTEVLGSDGLHPSASGYYQIADAIYRALCHDILTYFS